MKDLLSARTLVKVPPYARHERRIADCHPQAARWR